LCYSYYHYDLQARGEDAVKVLEQPAPGWVADPAEALIKEAHHRKRRRRLLIVAIAIVVMAIALGGMVLARAGHGSPTPGANPRPAGPAGPVVDKAAFAGHGKLAFVSRSTLWVVDGASASTALRQIRTPGLVPRSPSFSPDGKWLAFVASKEASQEIGGDVVSTVLSSGLWLARSDGSHAHPLRGVAIQAAFGWGPNSDLFAISVGTAATVPFGAATGVDLVSPTGAVRQLVASTHVTGAVWSPDGSALALSTQTGPSGPDPWSATLATYPVDGGPATVWQSLPAGYIVPAGWWPVWGIGYTTVGSGGVPGGDATADGSPLFAVARPEAMPRPLGTTLENGSAGVPSASVTGWLAFVDEANDGGAGRTIWQGWQVVVCSPVTTECTAVPHPAGTVTVDPVWSPIGATLAYAQGPVGPQWYSQQTVANWYDAHELHVFDPTSGSTSQDRQNPGATVPLWSHDMKNLLYVSNNGLWLGTTTATAPVEIAQPLFGGAWPTFYGQVAFSSQFSWTSDSRSSGTSSG
jgi:WD40-like Beta Propeller Repeat